MKKFVSAILALTLTLTLCPAVFAQDAATTYSAKAVTFIEEMEGYRQMQYPDAGGYYIGYGIGIEKDAYPDGVTQAQAEQMLKDYLDTKVVPDLNSFLSANSITLTQNQYDALCSFTYNLGSPWMSGESRLCNYLKLGISNYTDAQVVDAIGVFGHAGGVTVDGLVNRRIREAKIFLYGDYAGTSSPDYCWLIVDRNGGELGNDIFCFPKGGTYESMPSPTLTGQFFSGWKITETGKILNNADTVSQNLHAAAAWSATLVMPYKDVSAKAWYYDAVGYCYENKLMDGTSATAFSPDMKMSRAMLATVLWRMADKPVVNYAMPFTDVKEDSWYAEAVRWAVAQGITTGTSSTTFTPTMNITRADMVTMLYRYAKLTGAVTDTGVSMGLAGYADAGKIPQYAYQAFQWAVQMNVIKGSQTADGTLYLNPTDYTSRAQVAQVLENLGVMQGS